MLLRLVARHQASSVMATTVDFGAMVLFVSALGLSPVSATAIGATFGAVTNFALGRAWIFHERSESIATQGARYALTSAASLGLNTAGEWLAHEEMHVQYIAARALVAFVVSLAWNLPMQRFFVFRHAHR